MNKFVSVLVLGSALALSACGGDSDSSGGSYTGTVKPTPTKACNITGKTVTGISNDSCLFENASAEADMVITCTGSKMILDGKFGRLNTTTSKYTSGSTINGYVLQCP
ncbi:MULTISPECIES: hypothetical protein [unclassified Psychrobacter]|uniref:hypothetical protein n=1 Tax=unclassified Psychrobacter TaxID=196806 RepID=UPI0025B6110B|nr:MULTISPECIES: hypothetical protein [unclassified Psychrobacter]MDN3452413.1 hypothetical protein [Psychrobacter sp. APC 3350]MDN3502420.1 hypothetical protein [Psychrobacter sp. 5A.1]